MSGTTSTSVMVSTRIPKALFARLERMAKVTKWSKGELHRQALELFLPILEGGHCLADLPLSAVGRPDPISEAKSAPLEVDPGGDDAELLAFMVRVEPGAERGALVAFRELRKATKWLPAAFDARLLNAAQRGVISLHRHDHAAALSPADRKHLVEDDQGNAYIGAAIRQKG